MLRKSTRDTTRVVLPIILQNISDQGSFLLIRIHIFLGIRYEDNKGTKNVFSTPTKGGIFVSPSLNNDHNKLCYFQQVGFPFIPLASSLLNSAGIWTEVNTLSGFGVKPTSNMLKKTHQVYC